MTTELDAFLDAVRAEVERARSKFPDPAGSMAALTEEVGEVAKALLDEPSLLVVVEAIQVAAMAARVALEGDPSLRGIRASRGLGSHPVYPGGRADCNACGARVSVVKLPGGATLVGCPRTLRDDMMSVTQTGCDLYPVAGDD